MLLYRNPKVRSVFMALRPGRDHARDRMRKACSVLLKLPPLAYLAALGTVLIGQLIDRPLGPLCATCDKVTVEYIIDDIARILVSFLPSLCFARRQPGRYTAT